MFHRFVSPLKFTPPQAAIGDKGRTPSHGDGKVFLKAQRLLQGDIEEFSSVFQSKQLDEHISSK
jgi:hypothetical protein